MNTVEWAAKLNNREYPFRLDDAENELMRKDGIVVVYGGSDDLIEFRGAIDDEQGAPGIVHITDKGLLTNECDNDDCPHFKRLHKLTPFIESHWCTVDPYDFAYETTIPHETFEILEGHGGGEVSKYCRGIVFYLKDVK